ncbi:sulfite exporter TauE/SafE family protein [Deminuibacter soli]|uniref:Probable membrane transporter protein n=1 Tax=Deminuibacter soli TaxID=2291815 RepID=A0A3E1NIE9_9BACT|nr:sulfite exporter TauE/SafE family protein [Deminuibacter soli]RFM27707.1 sulfite exporter TauE/SafE family protein [Deminuibacter soli]
MSLLLFTLVILLASYVAGLLGAITGLGGGVIIIPVFTLALHIDLRYAIGTSLVTAIATSSGSAIAYVKEGISNIRVGMFLEIATTTGAICGAALAMYIPTYIIAIIFGVVLLATVLLSLRKHAASDTGDNTPNKLAARLRLNSTYPAANGQQIPYTVHRVPGGFFMMLIAGTISGLLGIGSGALKVVAMDTMMKLPFKVSTTTSNFMIGVTAAASAVVYFQRGYIDPGLSMPVVLGVLAGAFTGTRVLTRVSTQSLKIVFAIVVGLLSLQMIYNGVMHKL